MNTPVFFTDNFNQSFPEFPVVSLADLQNSGNTLNHLARRQLPKLLPNVIPGFPNIVTPFAKRFQKLVFNVPRIA